MEVEQAHHYQKDTLRVPYLRRKCGHEAKALGLVVMSKVGTR